MLELGLKNSRMKDYYDIALLAGHFAFDGATLRAAIEATLRQRGRTVPAELPTGLTDAFGADPTKSTQWSAFTRTHRDSELPTELRAVVRQVRTFLEQPLNALISARGFDHQWPPAGPWRTNDK